MTLEPLAQLRTSLAVERMIATAAFGALFVLGPVLTLLLGTGVAVLCTAAIVYLTIVLAIVSVWWRRRRLRLTVARCAWISLEVLLCPAFLPNLVRKVTASQRLETDAAQLLVVTRSDVDEDFLRRLERRAEDLIEQTSPGRAEQHRLQAYLAVVRAAR